MRFYKPYAATPSTTAAKRCCTCQAACASLPTEQLTLAPSERCTDPMGSPGQPYSHCMEAILMHLPAADLTVLVTYPVTIPARDGPGRLKTSGCEARRTCTCARMCMHHALVCNQPGRCPAPALQSAFAAAAAARFACAGSMRHWRSARLLPHCSAQ